MISSYVCPNTKSPLFSHSSGGRGLVTENGVYYAYIEAGGGKDIPDFRSAQVLGDSENYNLKIYDQSFSVERYRNELNWLLATFNETETLFRRRNVAKLKLHKGDHVLITACGLGGDIQPIAEAVGPEGKVYVQDLAPEMVLEATRQTDLLMIATENIHFSVGDAAHLPFADGKFDAAFHFGGINLFDDIKLSIGEMERVVKNGGMVVFGDESVGPWLRDTDYGRAAICNNSLWEVKTPIDLLPPKAINVELSWVLGSCFYLIAFQVSSAGPYMNMDVPHIGLRGGSMRTRYFGRIEGVREESKRLVFEEAAKNKLSVHNWLEEAILEKLSKK